MFWSDRRLFVFVALLLDLPIKPDELFEVESLVPVAVVNTHHVTCVLLTEAQLALQQRMRLFQRHTSASVRIERLERASHFVHDSRSF